MNERWTWPEKPNTARDLLAAYLRNWGRELAYADAERIIEFLAKRGWHVCPDKEAQFWLSCGEQPGWRSKSSSATQ